MMSRLVSELCPGIQANYPARRPQDVGDRGSERSKSFSLERSNSSGNGDGNDGGNSNGKGGGKGGEDAASSPPDSPPKITKNCRQSLLRRHSDSETQDCSSFLDEESESKVSVVATARTTTAPSSFSSLSCSSPRVNGRIRVRSDVHCKISVAKKKKETAFVVLCTKCSCTSSYLYSIGTSNLLSSSCARDLHIICARARVWVWV